MAKALWVTAADRKFQLIMIVVFNFLIHYVEKNWTIFDF
jgi:hypothetical protein